MHLVEISLTASCDCCLLPVGYASEKTLVPFSNSPSGTFGSPFSALFWPQNKPRLFNVSFHVVFSISLPIYWHSTEQISFLDNKKLDTSPVLQIITGWKLEIRVKSGVLSFCSPYILFSAAIFGYYGSCNSLWYLSSSVQDVHLCLRHFCCQEFSSVFIFCNCIHCRNLIVAFTHLFTIPLFVTEVFFLVYCISSLFWIMVV